MNDEINLKGISTRELCDELRLREGVEEIWLDPYEERDIHVEGWASVFIVID